MRPRRDEHGVPWCDTECPEFEIAPGFGNLCRLLGCRPAAICEPAVRELALRVARDLEVTPVEMTTAVDWPPEPSPFRAAREPATEGAAPRAVEPERSTAHDLAGGAAGERTAHPVASGESGSVFCIWCSTWGGHADGCAERRRGV
jgi:hypothetical protein